MIHLFKDDMWGNKVPYMTVSREVADELVKDSHIAITKIVDVPRSTRTIICM